MIDNKKALANLEEDEKPKYAESNKIIYSGKDIIDNREMTPSLKKTTTMVTEQYSVPISHKDK